MDDAPGVGAELDRKLLSLLVTFNDCTDCSSVGEWGCDC